MSSAARLAWCLGLHRSLVALRRRLSPGLPLSLSSLRRVAILPITIVDCEQRSLGGVRCEGKAQRTHRSKGIPLEGFGFGWSVATRQLLQQIIHSAVAQRL